MSMEEFHEIFFEEADELIEAMEAELLEMVFDSDNPERINNVFRAAHSIKGGAATFGFAEVTDTTHVMETLMNCVRDGEMKVTRDLIDLLLGAVDCVKDLLDSAKRGAPADTARADETREALESRLRGEAGSAAEPAPASPQSSGPDQPTETTDAAEAAPLHARRYRIEFRPSHELFKTGNDPLHILRALRELGELEVGLDPESIPALEHFEPDSLYLTWILELDTDAAPETVLEAFDWVEDVSEIELLEIVAEGADAPGVVASGAVPQTGAAADVLDDDAQADETDDVHDAVDALPPRIEAATRAERRALSSEPTSIRVGIDKIDTLINLVGELVITQSMLSEMGQHIETCNLEKLREGFSQLERHTRELQENVMRIRMVPISNVFNRLPRTVHDLTARLGKKLDLVFHGEQTELDKTVMERIGDPLIHLVRNAVDHGVEAPAVREASGKPQRGTLELRAYHANGDVVIEIRDDGAGLNTGKILAKAREKGLVGADERPTESQIHELIFHPGFSTADQVSDISGRGVGMDVVRQNIYELGGDIEIASEFGKGSTFTIRLPLTLAIVDGQLLRVADHVYIIPLVSILESFQLQDDNLRSIADRGQLYRIRGEYVPVVALTNLFGIDQRPQDRARKPLLMLVESGQGKIGLLVDDLLAQQQVVIKSLESNYRPVPGISGATILGDGRVALILDIPGLLKLARLRGADSGPRPMAVPDPQVA